MGTRSKVSFYREKKETKNHVVSIYQQFDGYLSGVGREILDFLKNGKVVNGISGSPQLGEVFNGIDCMASSFISIFKEKPGGLYITGVENSQEFNYDIIVKQTGHQFLNETFEIIIEYEEKQYTLQEFENLIK